MERSPPPWSQDSRCPPPARQHAASYATSKGHRHPSSSHQGDGGAGRGAGSPSLEAACGCPALTKHARCALGCATETQRQHLKREFPGLGVSSIALHGTSHFFLTRATSNKHASSESEKGKATDCWRLIPRQSISVLSVLLRVLQYTGKGLEI